MISNSKQGSSVPPVYSPYIADQFYNGKASTTTATLTFKMQQFGYSTVEIPKPSYMTTLGKQRWWNWCALFVVQYVYRTNWNVVVI